MLREKAVNVVLSYMRIISKYNSSEFTFQSGVN